MDIVSKYTALLGQKKLKESFVKDLELVLSRKDPNIEKEERMNYLTIHKCKNEDERKELKELCDWYFKDTPTLTMSFSLTEEDFRVTMERDVELSEVARAVKNQHHKKKI